MAFYIIGNFPFAYLKKNVEKCLYIVNTFLLITQFWHYNMYIQANYEHFAYELAKKLIINQNTFKGENNI